jgi:hypothetical protein
MVANGAFAYIDLIEHLRVYNDIYMDVTVNKAVFVNADKTVGVYELTNYTVAHVLAGQVEPIGVSLTSTTVFVTNSLACVGCYEISLFNASDYSLIQTIPINGSSIDVQVSTGDTLGVLLGKTKLLLYTRAIDGTFALQQTIDKDIEHFSLQGEFLVYCKIGYVTLYKRDISFQLVTEITDFGANWGASSSHFCSALTINVKPHSITLIDFLDVFIGDSKDRGGFHYIQFIGQDWQYHQRVFGSNLNEGLGVTLAYHFPYLIAGAPSYSTGGAFEMFDCSGICSRVEYFIPLGEYDGRDMARRVAISGDHVLISSDSVWPTKVYEIVTRTLHTCPQEGFYPVENECYDCTKLKAYYQKLNCCTLQTMSHAKKNCQDISAPCKFCAYLWEHYHTSCKSCSANVTEVCELNQDCLGALTCIAGVCA